MERNYAIDYFKFWAIFFVVCIHTSPFSGVNILGVEGHYLNLLIKTFARFGVPFFFVVSGFLFGQKILTSNNTGDYFNKYFLRSLWLVSKNVKGYC
ncbi:acyltransferase family protein [Halobacillus salinus]|uniref:acyltransferase family protein n=1 Tax=Halobacillus salinus TaxID=192814 RepID=UPI0013050F03|nr:acyltransferase family protein [Halobacillus salinus]